MGGKQTREEEVESFASIQEKLRRKRINRAISLTDHHIFNAYYEEEQPYTKIISVLINEPQWVRDAVLEVIRNNGFKIHFLDKDPELWEKAKLDPRNYLLKYNNPDQYVIIELKPDMAGYKELEYPGKKPGGFW